MMPCGQKSLQTHTLVIERVIQWNGDKQACMAYQLLFESFFWSTCHHYIATTSNGLSNATQNPIIMTKKRSILGINYHPQQSV